MKLSLNIKTSLSQTLTPQQIQYLKLLQLPLVQLEQQVRQEIEVNPMLEEFDDNEPLADPDNLLEINQNHSDDNSFDVDKTPSEKVIDDEGDPFEFYKLLWQDGSGFKQRNYAAEDDDNESYQIKDYESFVQNLIQQLGLLYLSNEENLAGISIVGNIDEDGYLRRDLGDILNEVNSQIAEHNFNIQQEQYMEEQEMTGSYDSNPAKQYALSSTSSEILGRIQNEEYSDSPYNYPSSNGNSSGNILKPLSMDQMEKVLKEIQHLDPPGIGSRNVQECLLAQLKSEPGLNEAQKLAIDVLTKTYDPFIKKHYQVITKQLSINDEELREAIDEIRRLNPKPGGNDYQHETNTVIPDFSIYREDESDELIIKVNDSRMPTLRLNQAYAKLKKEAKYRKFNKDTREWIRNKYEDAKFLIQAIRQRKSTMLKVMTSIAGRQRDFFDLGNDGLKPLIYKDIAEDTGLDISTVCRIVNGKYVQTPFGTYELKYFFSEALPSEDGEEVSTRIIKQKLKDIIDEESKNKPLSDEKISKLLKENGFNVARRTVAKYREQLKIPVARLRKEL